MVELAGTLLLCSLGNLDFVEARSAKHCILELPPAVLTLPGSTINYNQNGNP
jgi:hypothetical protein